VTIRHHVFETAPLTAVDAPQESAEAHLFIDDGPQCMNCEIALVFSMGLASVRCLSKDYNPCRDLG